MKGRREAFVLIVVSALCLMAAAAWAGPASAMKEKEIMIATQTKARGPIPPLDISAALVTQTATFALG
jgi:hypothetical protein